MAILAESVGRGGTARIGELREHAPRLVEQDQAQHRPTRLKDPRVSEAAVIGVPSDKWGETPVGFVVLKGAPETRIQDALEDIRATANARLGKTQRLALVHAIDEMPRSHIGKLLKTELRDLAAAKGGAA